MTAGRWALFMLGAGLIATAVLLHVKVGPHHKDSDYGLWNGWVVVGLFGFGVACVAVSTEGAS